MQGNFLENLLNLSGTFFSTFSTMFDKLNVPFGNTGFTFLTMMFGAGITVYLGYVVIKFLLDIIL